MQDFSTAFLDALRLLLTGDAALLGIVGLSLQVSLIATAIAVVVGAPAGAALAALRFPGREAIVVAVNALMG
ncbi:MAG: ABC transporter permease, partial [Pseudomonadota bacterium]